VRFDSVLLATLALLAATTIWAGPARVLEASPPKALPDFELTNQDGQPFRLSTLRGSPVLLFFGFANCPDVCPLTLGQLQMIAKSPDKAVRQARVVMVSVDGDRDKPADLKRYLGSVSPDFVGLTGDPRKVRDIAAQFSAVFFKGAPTDRSGKYLVEHTSQVYLLDRQGRLRSTFFNATVDAMTDATRVVALEKP
jgi:protein SCO1/2